MRKLNLSCAPLALALALAAIGLQAPPAHALAVAAPDHGPRAIGYALWDDEFLYLAARVDDTSLMGSNTTAMSEPWRDDSVDFYLDLTGAASDAVHPGCARFVVSVASGFSCLVGTAAGTWRPQPEWLLGLRVAVERQGTLNQPRDTDTGFTVEMGIPWKFLGGTPSAGRSLGLNFVVHVRGENEASVSWSSRAQSPADYDRPNLWGQSVLSPNSKPSVAEGDVLICPRTYVAPLVDGRLTPPEWLGASVLQLDKPAPETIPRPAGAGKLGGRLLATYRYDYQALTPRQEGDAAPPSLVDQPADGIGPWFSADSVAWHKAMLRQAREAGIDTILAVYRGDPDARKSWSRRGLLRLVQGLKETKDERLTYPLVGMYLDASCLPAAGAADLASPVGRQALWGMIAEFFSIVPDEFRAQFDFSAGGCANLLVLGPPQGLENWDAAAINFCRDSYRRAFGARLIVLGDDAWRSRAPNLDGYCSLAPGSAFGYGAEGPHSVARVTPGYVGAGAMVPRHDGQSYEQSWMRTLSVLPDFVLVDSLNDFEAGSEIAYSREHGLRFLDLTRQSAQMLAGRREYQIALRRETLPPVLHAGATYQIELLLENQGFQNLSESENVEISYKLQNRRRPDAQRTGIATSPLLVRAGQRAPVVVQISTRRIEGPLPDGDYDLTFEVTQSTIPILRSHWFAKQLFEVSLPVRIERAPGERATVLSTGLPSAMGAGARQRVRVRLRNDGSRAWGTKSFALSYHWLRIPGPGAGEDAKPEVVELEGVRTPLPKAVAPGEMITAYAWVEARKADGSPLPAWTPDDDWLYQLQWDLVEGQDRWFSRLGGAPYPESIAVLASDLGASVINADLPDAMEAGKTYPVKVLVRNDGSSAWDGQRVRISYHWYYWDGGEAAWQGSVTPLSSPLAPRGSAMFTAEVIAPDFAGSYRLAWDLMFDDHYASEMLDAGSRSLLVQPVTVSGGIYQPLDLSGQLNVFASTHDAYRGRGAFDVAGLSFPAEFVPPDSAAGKTEQYPAIYFGGARGWSSLARVPLRYPPMDQRGGAALACLGQQIALPGEPLRAIYIAASASAPVEAEFRVTYADGASQPAVLSVPSWTAPTPEATVALRAPFVRGTPEDVLKPACIYLLRIGDLSGQQPTALVLPSAPHIKVFAITLERPSAPAAGGS